MSQGVFSQVICLKTKKKHEEKFCAAPFHARGLWELKSRNRFRARGLDRGASGPRGLGSSGPRDLQASAPRDLESSGPRVFGTPNTVSRGDQFLAATTVPHGRCIRWDSRNTCTQEVVRCFASPVDVENFKTLSAVLFFLETGCVFSQRQEHRVGHFLAPHHPLKPRRQSRAYADQENSAASWKTKVLYLGWTFGRRKTSFQVPGDLFFGRWYQLELQIEGQSRQGDFVWNRGVWKRCLCRGHTYRVRRERGLLNLS